MFKVNNKNTRMTSGVSGEFEHNFKPFSNVFIVDFEQVNVWWASTQCYNDM